MSERYDIAIKVISQKGTCVKEHKVGEEWVIKDKTPAGICTGAFVALYPAARVLMYGGSFPWASDPDVVTVPCPDAESPVVFELRRLRK